MRDVEGSEIDEAREPRRDLSGEGVAAQVQRYREGRDTAYLVRDIARVKRKRR